MSHLKQNANQVPVAPITNLTATEVQAALAEHQADIDALAAGGDGVVTNAAISGETIDFTGTGAGFNGSVDISAIPSVAANTAKTGITAGQASAITANTAKGDYDAAAIALVAANTAKVSYTDAAAVTANTAKITYPAADAAKVANLPADQGAVNTANTTALAGKEDTANKGVNNGYASLGGTGKVPVAQLPSYVDDVIEGANLAAFPGTGETGKIYVAIDTNKSYRWGGASYTEISSGAVQSVNGETGIITLDKTHIGLSNVDNTTDLLKPISTATQTALDGKEDDLGNPATDGEVLSSTAAGVRSWVDPSIQPYRIEAANYTITNADKNIEMSTGGTTATLPTAVGIAGKSFTVDNSSGADITLTGAQTINGDASLTIPAEQSAHVMSNGAVWRIK